MTQRERLAPTGATELAPRPVAEEETSRPGLSRASVPSLSWEAIYLAASPSERHDLLALARRQGFLYSHQLPDDGDMAASARERSPDRLQRLLAGDIHDLEPVGVESLPFVDAALDDAQKQAVVGAVATPDLFLIEGLPGTGKSRVVAEIVTQAALRGDRVLLLGVTAASIDHVLEQVGDREALCPVRCLGRDERIEQLPPSSRALTFAERVRQLREEPLEAARKDRAEAEARCQQRRRQGAILDQLQAVAVRLQDFDHRLHELGEQRARVPAQVRQEIGRDETSASAGVFFQEVAATKAEHRSQLRALDQQRSELRARLEARQKDEAELSPRLGALRPLAEAKRTGRWWSIDWWRATLDAGLLTEYQSLEAAAKQAETDRALLSEEIRRLVGERSEAETRQRDALSRQAEAEISARVAQLGQDEEALRGEQAAARAAWELALSDLGDATIAPGAMTPDSVRDARSRWDAGVREDEQHRTRAGQAVRMLEEAADAVEPRLVQYANLVAATTAALPRDPIFGDAEPFDLLVLQEAGRVTRSEFIELARRAKRWVLVAEASGQSPGFEGQADEPRSGFALRSRFFHDLWQMLHCDPRTLPYSWAKEGDRLVCRLRPVPAHLETWVERERVADTPEIEIRILNAPRQEPLLTAVVFPARMSLAEAKRYVFQELQELSVGATRSALVWSEGPESVSLHLGRPAPADAVRVPLESGVWEVLAHSAKANGSAAAAWQSSHLEFDRHAGWDAARAREWARRHLGLRDPGRTARLGTPYRMKPGLAGWLADVLFPGAFDPTAPVADAGQVAIELVSVATVPADEAGRNGKRSSARPAVRPPTSARGGAGLELDLGDQRHRDRLPSELRGELPEAGLVNFLEAQAVVRTLEALAQEPASGEVPFACRVGVIALYPAQVSLIRRLIQQSTVLNGQGLCVDTPEGFREREYPVVLVSTTRSHTHRAVSFGDGPDSLALALTRARDRLLIFGDPGTMMRRSQWEGVVDHLDEAASRQERALLLRLALYLEGRGALQQAFRARRGSGA